MTMAIPSEPGTLMTAGLLTPGATRAPLEVDPHGTFLHTKNFASLNGIRCLCCLAVIKEHVHWNFPGPRLLSMGDLGVPLFFVISGFLIVTLLIRERERRGGINLGKFYARRSLRIFPIYYLSILAVLGLTLAVSYWRPNAFDYYKWAFPVLLTYTQDFIRAPLGTFNPCWTLAMEEQFYLFWPTVEKFAAWRLRWVLLVAMILVNLAVLFGLFNGLIVRAYGGDPTALTMPMFLITFTPILLGVLLAYLLNDRRSFLVLYRVIGHRWSPLVMLILLFAASELTGAIERSLVAVGLYVIFMLLLGSLVIREDHVARPFLTLPPLDRLGVISYGIYLYHLWVITIVVAVAGRFLAGELASGPMFFAGTIGTIAVAEASYRWIEQPFLRIKERFHT
jgi:peptidoglycan/LPS O-acetylase OafA/YrhL